MNHKINKFLTKEATRYKAIHKKQEEYDKLYIQAVNELKTAQTCRTEALNNYELLGSNPAQYKDVLKTYDKITIPQLKKNLRIAEKKRFENPELSEWKWTIILVSFVGIALTPMLVYKGTMWLIISALLVAGVLVVWVKYRSVVIRMSQDDV